MNKPQPFEQIVAIAAAPGEQNPPVLFAAATNGLYTSSDGGESWANALEKSGFPGTEPITALMLSPAADGSFSVYAGAVGGILRSLDRHSSDRGQRWEAVSFGQPAPVITAFTSSRQNVIHAATMEDGVFTSTDGGKSWSRWNFGLLDWKVMSITSTVRPDSHPIIFAGTESGSIYASKNNGRTWTETAFPDAPSPVMTLSASPDGLTLLAGTENGALFCSPDCGESWSEISTGFTPDTIGAILIDSADTASGNNDASGSEWAAAVISGSRLLTTVDSGQTWQALSDKDCEILHIAAPGGLKKGAGAWAACDDGRFRNFTI